MLRELGYLLLVFCFLTSFYGCVSAFLSIYTRQRSLLLSSRVASLYSVVLSFLACLVLSFAFFRSNFSLDYVYRNSSQDLPSLYRLSALWSSLEGSHLLWTFLLSVCATVSLWSYPKKNESYLPQVSFLAQGVLSWMFFLCITSSNPFEAAFPVPKEGLGMNELLQNPYMMIHPPCLFLGYTSLFIPFCYSFSSLWNGYLSNSCLSSMRRWSLFAWIFLTVGIFLGGRWAYVELGWAGYWAWDPVENSSFVPWLFLSALLHTLLVVRQSGKYEKLIFLFSFLAFFFCFFGTFLTRSGVVSSVHSFAQSDVATNYLVFLGLLILVFLVTYAFKGGQNITLEKKRFPFFYQIDFLILGILLFVSFALIVLMGTLYPMVSEYITGVRFSVQAPYFNSFAPYIGFAFILLITLGNLFGRKAYSKHLNLRSGSLILSLSLFFGFLFCLWGNVFETKNLYGLTLQILGVFLCFTSAFFMLYDFVLKYRSSSQKRIQFLRAHLGTLGALVSHLGLFVAVLGFLGNYRGHSKLVTLNKSEEISFSGYQIRFEGLRIRPQDNVLLFEGQLALSKGDKDLGSIFPARAKYPTKDELIHEVDYFSSFWHDVYVTLIDYDQETGLWATLDFHINPTVRLVWLSALFFLFGGLLSFSSTRPLRGLKPGGVK